MIIVGNISGKKEAEEIEFIAKSFIMGNRARVLAQQAKINTKMNG